MDGLAEYGSSDSELSPSRPGITVQADAGVVSSRATRDTALVAHGAGHGEILAVSGKSLRFNATYDEMMAPVAGPEKLTDEAPHPELPKAQRNHRAGHVQMAHMHAAAFDSQYNAYDLVGSGSAEGANGETKTVSLLPAKRKKTAEERAAARKRREDEAREAQALAEAGMPFRLVSEGHAWMNRQKWALAGPEEAEKASGAEGGEETEGVKEREDDKVTVSATGEKSFFHMKSRRDYQGREWIEPPPGAKKEDMACFLPKRVVHEYAGHAKGVAGFVLFPETGHMLLSAGMDGKVKIWDAEGSHGYKCLRTYAGHDKGVRGVHFSNDGRRFLSVSYDRTIKLWDTESGKCISAFGKDLGKTFFCAKFHPDDDKQNVLMAACQDKKVYQWDMNTGEVVQQYDQHQGAVNTITFVDDNRRFVTTSDDKSIRVWDFGIPFCIKYIADPTMHSMPFVAKRPDEKYVLMQSLNNEIMAYGAKDRFTRFKKKTFSGHLTAGYACQVSCSPDGKFVSSGDGEGRAFFWDWKNGKVARTLKAHDGVCIGIDWHPLHTSRVFTCGWDGAIKMWD